MRSPCIDAAIAELRAAGVYDYELVRGGKHWQVQWVVKDGVRRFYALPGTPSDWRSARNVRADIRRLLKADDLITAPDPPAERPPPRSPTLAQRLEALERTVAALVTKVGGCQ
jgi:hypothetical protein